MEVSVFAEHLKKHNINTVTGVPDSALKQFCYYLNQEGKTPFCHYVPANEGAAVAVAAGHYLATGNPACVYMQNSGLGNAVNPVTSLANEKVYGIPVLFLIGWRGMPGVKDEPQHRFMGEITCTMLKELAIPYAVIKKQMTEQELEAVLVQADHCMAEKKQFALVAEPGAFESDGIYLQKNFWNLVREEAVREILSGISEDDIVVSTTGKISREVYEQSDKLRGHHKQAFLTVGGMGHASMVAFGIAKEHREKTVYCIDGDGAVLMHMGSMAFLGRQQPRNMVHICLNNDAHESVGGMPTGCSGLDFAPVASACGYPYAEMVSDMAGLQQALCFIRQKQQLSFLEVKVSLKVREDLGRPKETAAENKEAFMEYHNKKSMG